MTKSEIVELIYKSIPYSNQIENLDLESESDAVRFEWRGNKFRVSQSGCVAEVDEIILKGSDIALLIETLLKLNTCLTT